MLPIAGRDLCVEVKARADGFRELYSWLEEGRDVLIVKADRQEPSSSYFSRQRSGAAIITYFSWLRDPCDPHLLRTF